VLYFIIMELDKVIEGVLFWKGEPVSLDYLSHAIGKPKDEVLSAMKHLDSNMSGRGLVLIQNGDEYSLATSPGLSAIIQSIAKDEMNRDLSKTSLETLSIILYKGPIRRSEIDFVRGVNSAYIIRSLLIRGLVEKISDPKDDRAFLYKPTIELMSHLGLSKIENLPEYDKVTAELETWKTETTKNPEQVPDTQS